MAPKQSKMSSSASSSGGYTITPLTDEELQMIEHAVCQMDDVEFSAFLEKDLTHSPLMAVSGCAEERAKFFHSKFLESLESEKRVKTLRRELKKEETKKKSVAKKEQEKNEKAEKRNAIKKLTLLFNGQVFELDARGTLTLGALRKQLIELWNRRNPNKPIAMVRASKIAVLLNSDKLHLHPRATLNKTLSDEATLHCSFMCDEDADVASAVGEIDDEENINEEPEEETDDDDDDDKQ